MLIEDNGIDKEHLIMRQELSIDQIHKLGMKMLESMTDPMEEDREEAKWQWEEELQWEQKFKENEEKKR